MQCAHNTVMSREQMMLARLLPVEEWEKEREEGREGRSHSSTATLN